MAKGFLDAGWEVSVLTERLNPTHVRQSWEGAEITEFDYAGTPYRPKISLHTPTQDYGTYLKSQPWDIVVFHSYEQSLMCALPLLNELPSRKILVSHGYGALVFERGPRFPYGFFGLCRRFLKSLQMIVWMRRFDRIVYLSEQADLRGFYDHLIAKVAGYRGRRVIPNGVDIAERGDPQSDFRQIHGIPDDAFMLLCVANYSTRKDQAYAVRAFRKAAVEGSVLVFIGSEFNEHARRFQAADEASMTTPPVGRIIWLEKQSRESTVNAYAVCDCCVLSAYHEAQPISLLEAMREGKPWIARKAGCIATMEGGICVDTTESMASAIRLLADDEATRKRLGEEGSYAVATRYNRQAYFESYRKLIGELVKADS